MTSRRFRPRRGRDCQWYSRTSDRPGSSDDAASSLRTTQRAIPGGHFAEQRPARSACQKRYRWRADAASARMRREQGRHGGLWRAAHGLHGGFRANEQVERVGIEHEAAGRVRSRASVAPPLLRRRPSRACRQAPSARRANSLGLAQHQPQAGPGRSRAPADRADRDRRARCSRCSAAASETNSDADHAARADRCRRCQWLPMCAGCARTQR